MVNHLASYGLIRKIKSRGQGAGTAGLRIANFVCGGRLSASEANGRPNWKSSPFVRREV